MASRSVWTGAITFGLVNVPVKLFGSTSSRELHFHLLHAKDDGRVQYRRTCALDGAEVPFDETVRAFELSPGRLVKFEPKELERIHPVAMHTIEIEDFVALAEIDPLYFDARYHVLPEKGAGRPYALLRDAMATTGRVGIARMVLRTRQYLCAVRPGPAGMLVSTLHFADELVATAELGVGEPAAVAKPRELEMARQLIESLASEWKPEKYRDDYREQVLALIEKKAAGEEIVEAAERAPDRPVDLAAALEASLAAGGRRPATAPRPARRASPRSGARRSRS